MVHDELFFETVKCDDGMAYNLEYHCRRIARTIMINVNLQEYILPISDDFLKCKVFYDHYGVIDVEYTPYIKRIINSFKLMYDDTIEYKCKSVNRDHINTLFEQRGNADDIIIVKDGFITDTSIANLAIYDGTSWLTPKGSLLRGTMQEQLLDKKELIQANISVEMLKNAKKIALLNAMVGMNVLENFTIIE